MNETVVTAIPRPSAQVIVPIVVQQHADEAVSIRNVRSTLVSAPHIRLRDLRRWDDRLAAHLDGLSVAGEQAWPYCDAALELPSVGAIFTAGVRAIEAWDVRRLDALFALAEAIPAGQRGLISAFGWQSHDRLQGVVVDLLKSNGRFRRSVGVAACAVHRVDPGLFAARRCEDAEPQVRARALRTAGELGKSELRSHLGTAIADDDADCRFWAAWSAVLLGDRRRALESLLSMALTPNSNRAGAFQVVFQVLHVTEAHERLSALPQDAQRRAWLIRGVGYVGDPSYAPWLIGSMRDPETAQIAGEAFSLITGCDLERQHLDRDKPEDIEQGPDDNAENPDVAMSADQELPWPDAEKVQAWWHEHGAGFATGARHFMGAPVSRERCIEVLRNGYQRQRIVAAIHLGLLTPGTPLFEWRAPAWRQAQAMARLT